MGRLKENRIKIVQRKNGQFLMTLPRKMARELDISKGDVVLFSKDREGVLRICKEGL